MGNNRTTPYGMWRYGNDFRKAARAVLSHYDIAQFMPYYFLLGQSIELSLKAFLLGHGTPLKELRSKKYGHDLEALLNEAYRLGLEVKLDGTHRAVIHLLGVEYLDRRFQYIRTGMLRLPEPRLAQAAADKLSDGLEKYFERVTKL